MTIETLAKSLQLVNIHRHTGTITTEEAFEVTILLTEAYEKGLQHEQVQATS